MGTTGYDPDSLFAQTYHRCGEMLFRLCMIQMGNRADAEDVVQETFYRLLTRAPRFASGEHEKRWLIRVAVNLCHDRQKSIWNSRVDPLNEEIPSPVQQEETAILEQILQLPPKYKAVIHLYYFEGYSISEIAQILHIGISAVKMRLSRGRTLLKMEWEEESL